VRSCNRDVTFSRAPSRAVSNDVNLTEMMLSLGLRASMAGYTGIDGWKTARPALHDELDGLPQLAQRYPSLETLVAVRADLYVAGWNYGLRVGGAVTPASLDRFGIATYELTESCAHVMQRPAASLDDVYQDLRNLGAIFDVDARADALISAMRARGDAVAKALGPNLSRPRVFVYDSGEDKPFTAGALAMPTALIHAAGGVNVMDDVAQSWTQVSWESVIARNPQAIVAVAPPGTAHDWLAEWKRFSTLSAVKNGALIPFEDQRLSRLGPSAVGGTEALCEALDAQAPRP
jgi:iron complex transport system substrate-binding protein